MEFINDLDAQGNFKEKKNTWKSRNLQKMIMVYIDGQTWEHE